MLMTIGLFFAVIVLLLIGYVGEIFSSVTGKYTSDERQHNIETDIALEGTTSR